MSNKILFLNRAGFTFIELISVIAILGVLASVVVKKVDFISDTAAEQALAEGIRELNIRESLSWTNVKLSSNGWSTDSDIYTAIDTDLGADYIWNPGPTISGGTLHFRHRAVALTRIPSTAVSSAEWN
jgi:prepilin-type N-terminal cleavage/methylation domain-containing protein